MFLKQEKDAEPEHSNIISPNRISAPPRLSYVNEYWRCHMMARKEVWTVQQNAVILRRSFTLRTKYKTAAIF